MKKRYLFLGAIVLILLTCFSTIAGLYYLLGLGNTNSLQVFRFVNALRFIQTQYVNEVDNEKLITGALKGMVNSLDDPHSVYLDEQMYKLLLEHTDGSFGGVGVVMGMREDKIPMVIAPIEGSPSELAGIKSGDQIISVDGQDTRVLPFEEVAAKIRGEIGTQVVLTIRRDNADIDYILTRSNIETISVAGSMKREDIGYIRIASFNEHTATEFNKIYHELEEKGMKKVILDLRDNPGGILTVCTKIAENFVPEGVIVSTRDRAGNQEVFRSSLPEAKYPLVVLVNGGSASASEIVAGAIQDTGVGTLIGTKTYGKGSVQAVIPMANKDGMKLTIAKYYTPNDRCIDGIGIEPDITIELDKEKDNQLEKAIEVLQGK